MQPMQPIIYRMSASELDPIFRSITIDGSNLQFCIENQIFSGQISSDPRILRTLGDLVARSYVLGVSESHTETIQKINKVFGDILVESRSVVNVNNSLTESTISATNRFETDLAKAKAGEYIPACLRIALHICLMQMTRHVDCMKMSLPTREEVDLRMSRPVDDMKTLAPTREEVHFLYDEFINAFGFLFHRLNAEWEKKNDKRIPYTLETLPISLGVDSFPHESWGDIMMNWNNQILDARRAAGEMRRFPFYDGLGRKCTYIAEGGCAKYVSGSGCFIISHDGTFLKENPWETFFRSEKIEDQKLAKELCPVIPEDIDIKFKNREIERNGKNPL